MGFKLISLYSIIFLLVADTFFYISITGAQGAYFTPVSLFCKYSVLVILIYVAKNTNWKFDSEKSIVVLYKTLLYWNIVSLIHAIFVASGYWDWKFLFFSSALFSFYTTCLFSR
ncbi:hypothetical protein BWI97_19060 [Siphonobacter sp. BAB-5405]|nr:hypothetical protein BWI97_19060 [Siphonobacter sp. BAB-5405]